MIDKVDKRKYGCIMWVVYFSLFLIFLTDSTKAVDLDSTIAEMQKYIGAAIQKVQDYRMDAKIGVESITGEANKENFAKSVNSLEFRSTLTIAEMTLTNCAFFFQSLKECRSKSACDGFYLGVDNLDSCASYIQKIIAKDKSESSLLILQGNEVKNYLRSLARDLRNFIERPEIFEHLCGE